ncbi:hypothetical protein ACONUD_02320 [Microbulbifer harenosus]|uniref:HEPN domain-containing protein n=1 Tax=Microbulbifer harenosus TaxID=2576840 RepID=A0ABY2UCH4_9GAMM|nr:hypothetical protein [Microbulbifer harenosus]TLM73198.1 hypothetical protein FDY93_19130 [Microbulbifer harenosus]
MHKDIDEVLVRLNTWGAHLRTTVQPLTKNIAYKPTFDADYYREAVLYRFIELAKSACQLYKSNLLIGSLVSVRAAQETIAVAWFINYKLDQFSKNKDLKHFSETVRRLILGWSNDAEFPEKINVFKCIDSVDKVLEGKFRRHYEMLSEYAHPNYSGTFGAYGSTNIDTLEVTFGSYPRSEKTLKRHIKSTLTICVSLLEMIQEKSENSFNSALDVCHELHEQGKLMDQLQ